MEALGIWISAFLTLCIFSFLYKDNPFYKFAEHLFIGVSAGYWLGRSFQSVLMVQCINPLLEDFLRNWHLLIPLALSIMLLMRLVPNYAWVSRIPLGFIVGTYAGINFINYLRSNALQQIKATVVPMSFTLSSINPIIILIGVLTGLFYFFFSKEHKGVYYVTAKIGIYFLMVAFGASFGYTVMARISLLIGRFQFLLGDWLGVI